MRERIGEEGSLIAQTLADDLGFGFAALGHGVDKRQCWLALGEIVADIFAEAYRIAVIVECVVDKLKGGAYMQAKKSQRILCRGIGVRQNSTTVSSRFEQNCSLVMDDLHIALLGRRRVVFIYQLKDFAFGDFVRCVCHNFHYAHIADTDE